MKKILSLLVILTLVYSCTTSKSVIIDKDKKLENKTIDFYRESNEEAYEKIIKEIEKKQSVLNNKAPISKEELKEVEEEVLVATSKVKVTKEIVLQYISKYRAVAIDNMNNYNIPASITLAQGILESGSGTSTLSFKANNHFGIKCHANWEGESVTHDDDAPNECFRKYKNPRDSYRDHSIFLTTRKWYEPLFQLNIKDYKGWADGLKKSGYATDPKYPQKLISIIERYDLSQYDEYYSQNNKSTEVVNIDLNDEKNEDQPIISEVKKDVEEVKKVVEEKKPEIVEVKTKTNEVTTNENTPKQKLIENSKKTHTVVKGDTLYNISKRYNITIEKLKKLNNITESSISLGQELIIQ